MRRFALIAVGIFIVWLALAGRLTLAEVVTGALVAAGVAALSRHHLALLDDIRLTPMLPVHLARYFWTFFIALVGANLDVARRVISPKLDIHPALVEVRTALTSDLGKLWLANSITLTPGTLSVDVVGDVLKVHWIDATPGRDMEHATRAIAEKFEARLKGFLS